MRILMYSTYFPPQYSGAAKQAISLAKRLKSRGHHIEFLTVKWPGLETEDSYEGFPVHRVEMGRGQRHKEFRLWWNLLKFTMSRRRDFHIFHSHGAGYNNAIVGPIGKLLGWRSVVKATLANNDLHGLKASLAGRLHYLFLKMVDVYVAISQDLEEEFLSAGLSRSKVHLMSNGVDTSRFYPVVTTEKSSLRQELGLPTERPIVLSVGVFDERKNIGWLIDEWVSHRGFENHAYLLAIGPQSREDFNGDFLRSLKELENNHSDLLGIMDHVDNIEHYYRAVDYFILPSTSEGMPNVILEAMASGLPCIATDVSGTRDLVEDGITGYLFNPGDSDGLSHSVNTLLSNKNSEMSHMARRIVEKKYSIDVLALNYERLYMDLLKKDIKCNTNRDIEG